MILVDSNVLMYAAGADHANKAPSLAFLDRVARGVVDAAIDAEVLQEILHRYRAIHRWSDGQRLYDLARRLFPVVFPVTVHVLDQARRMLDDHEGLSARDALHAAVARIHDCEAVCSFDTDYDGIAAVRRMAPA